MLDGMLLAKQQYDTSGKLISATTSSWTVATQIATNPQGTPLRTPHGGIPQVYATTNMLDGVTTTTEIAYSLASGNPTRTTSSYYGSTGEEITRQTLTTYAYEKYATIWQQNLLKLVAQTTTQTKTASATNYEIQAINVQTYQQWNGTKAFYWAPNAQYTATTAGPHRSRGGARWHA